MIDLPVGVLIYSFSVVDGGPCRVRFTTKDEHGTPYDPASITPEEMPCDVLCVGGRSGNAASHRDVVERVGGRFAHHDGGLDLSEIEAPGHASHDVGLGERSLRGGFFNGSVGHRRT